MQMKTVIIGGDHAGFAYKEMLKTELANLGYKVVDYGPYSDASCDYPDYAHKVAKTVETEANTVGILICGSANGVAITANKHQGIRAALCWNADIAALSRQHNNANIVCLPARFTTTEQALEIARTFLETDFEGGRHENRVNKIACA